MRSAVMVCTVPGSAACPMHWALLHHEFPSRPRHQPAGRSQRPRPLPCRSSHTRGARPCQTPRSQPRAGPVDSMVPCPRWAPLSGDTESRSMGPNRVHTPPALRAEGECIFQVVWASLQLAVDLLQLQVLLVAGDGLVGHDEQAVAQALRHHPPPLISPANLLPAAPAKPDPPPPHPMHLPLFNIVPTTHNDAADPRAANASAIIVYCPDNRQ